MKIHQTIPYVFVIFPLFCALPAFAETKGGLTQLEHYTPPPMFNTQGYDDATIRTSVGYKDAIESEPIEPIAPVKRIDPRVVPQAVVHQESFKPPLPPRRPSKVTLSKRQAEQIRKQFERGYTSENTLSEDLVSPSVEDVLHTIDGQ